MSRLSHVGEDGRARMVDVSDKERTARTATAEGRHFLTDKVEAT